MTLGLRYTARPGAAYEWEQWFAAECAAGRPPDQYKPSHRPIQRIYNELISQGRRKSSHGDRYVENR